MSELFNYISLADIISLIFFVACWFGYAWFAEHKKRHSRSLLAVTNEYRTQWMREMIKRDNRSTDAITIGNLQRSITFFASTSIFIVLGLISMLGYHNRFAEIVENIPFANASSLFLWQMKIFLLIILFIYAFFKYTWSLRQYNYAGIFVGSVPHYNECKDSLDAIAARGGFLVGNAAKHFNNGLRAYYYGLAALSWFLGPYWFMFCTAWVVFVTQRREYHSATLTNLVR